VLTEKMKGVTEKLETPKVKVLENALKRQFSAQLDYSRNAV